MYVGLIVAWLAAAGALIWGNVREAWIAAVLLPISAIVRYTLIHTTGLPQAHGDIGKLVRPLGLATLHRRPPRRRRRRRHRPGQLSPTPIRQRNRALATAQS